jgi:hypothetical protein
VVELNCNLMTYSYRHCHTAFIVEWHCHSAQERILYLYRDISFFYLRKLYRDISSEHDPPMDCKARLLLRQPQELHEDLEPPPVSCVHYTVAPSSQRHTALIGFLRRSPSEVLPSKCCHPLPLFGKLGYPLGASKLPSMQSR